MLLCWRHSPRQRPTFSDIIEMLEPDLNQAFVEDSYYFTAEHQEALANAAAATEAAANAGDQSEGEDGVDACTPLTGRSPKEKPHRVHHRSGCSEPPSGEDGETFPLQTKDDQASSLQSSTSLSYQSHKSDSSPPCSHRSPSCRCVDIDKDNRGGNPMWHRGRGGGQGGATVGGPNGGGGSGDKWNPQPPPSSKWSLDTSSSPNSAIQSNEGSKESSKSSNSSHSHLNGGVMNGHIPRGYISPPRC